MTNKDTSSVDRSANQRALSMLAEKSVRMLANGRLTPALLFSSTMLTM